MVFEPSKNKKKRSTRDTATRHRAHSNHYHDILMMKKKISNSKTSQLIKFITMSATQASAAANTAKGMFYKITQLRSTIGLPPIVRKNIQALGLRKRNHIIYQKVSPSTAHRLVKVKEIVKVELVDEPKTPQQLAAERKFDPGFEIHKGNAFKSYD